MNAIQSKLQIKQKPLFQFWRCFWLSFLFISLAYAWYCFYAPSNKIAWAQNYEQAQNEAVESGKPMVLFFTGQWCVPCRMMKRQVWADAKVTETINSQFVPLEIDVSDSKNSDLLDRFNVKGAPVAIVTDPNGNPIDWRAGGMGKSEFLKLLQSPGRSTTQ